MRPFLRILNLLAFLASLAWLITDPSWEPLVTFLTLLATLLVQFFLPSDPLKIEPDRKLFNRLHDLLPSQRMRFISDYNFGAAFRIEWIEPLFDFAELWTGPDHEFDDKKLERKKNKLRDTVREFTAVIALNTFPEKPSIQRLPRELQRDDPKEYWKLAEKINELASQVSNDHQDLVRCAKKRLKL